MQNVVPHRQTRWRRMTAAAIPSPSNWTTAGPSCQAASATFWCGASPLPQLDPGRSSDRGFSSGQRSTLPDPFVNAPPCADDDVNNLPLHPYFFNRTRGTTIGVDQLSNLGASPRTTRLFRLRQLPPIAFEPIVMARMLQFPAARISTQIASPAKSCTGRSKIIDLGCSLLAAERCV
jgi:hypothetical protein